MIAPPNLIEYQKVVKMYDKCSSFIRGIHNHTEGEDLNEYGLLRAEINSLSDKTDRIITEMDAFEQIELGRK